VTGLTFIHKVVKVQADLWVVAVLIIQPYLMVYYLTRLIMTDLTQPAIYSQPIVYISLPSQAPGFGLVELFLVHSTTSCIKRRPGYNGAGLTALLGCERNKASLMPWAKALKKDPGRLA
jgi:hypothetical protein